MTNGDVRQQLEIERAIASMLDQYRGNDWMRNEQWPLFERHVRLMMTDVTSRFPATSRTRILDVGCFNGYISVLFKQLGYQVTATDAYDSEERRAIFQKIEIEFIPSNMNELDAFNHLPGEWFDIILFTQVIEHILNHPAGLVSSLARLMRPGGLMVLTTPNPATVMAALRLLKGNSLLWGTRDFIGQPKIDGGTIISKADIHYREYTSDEIYHMLTGAGLRVEKRRYLGLGNTPQQSALKRLMKSNPLAQSLMSLRPFASNHYFLARKPREPEP